MFLKKSQEFKSSSINCLGFDHEIDSVVNLGHNYSEMSVKCFLTLH